MPTLGEVISRIVFSKRVVNALRPQLREMIKEEAGQAITDKLPSELSKVEALAKSQNMPVSYAIPNGQIPGSQFRSDTKPQTGVSFPLLRDFSVFYWAARACINKRQEQIANLPWDIVSVDEKIKANPKDIKAVNDFFKNIAGPNKRFSYFLDMIIEDLLTLDGAAIYNVRDYGDTLRYLKPIDAATIRLVVDQSGDLLEPPADAFEQWIRGKKVASMTTEDMTYLMLNPRSSSGYGLSPLESLLLVVQSALKSEMSNLSILHEGNVPEGFISLPEAWTPQQIQAFQEWFDGLMSGNFAFTRRIKFLPGGTGVQYIPTKKPSDMEFAEFEKWLTIKTCALFGVSPQSIGITFDINKATAAEQSVLVRNESIQPLAHALEDYFNDVIQKQLGYENLRFSFGGFDAQDQKVEADINQIYIYAGVKTINEARKELNLEPVGPDGDKRFIMTSAGPVLLEEVGQLEPRTEVLPAPAPTPTETPTPPPPKQEPVTTKVDEFGRWQRKAIKDVKEGRAFRKFDSDLIEQSVVLEIEGKLQDCKNPAEVRAVFKRYLMDNVEESAMQLAEHLSAILKSDGPHPTVAIKG